MSSTVYYHCVVMPHTRVLQEVSFVDENNNLDISIILTVVLFR